VRRPRQDVAHADPSTYPCTPPTTAALRLAALAGLAGPNGLALEGAPVLGGPGGRRQRHPGIGMRLAAAVARRPAAPAGRTWVADLQASPGAPGGPHQASPAQELLGLPGDPRRQVLIPIPGRVAPALDHQHPRLPGRGTLPASRPRASATTRRGVGVMGSRSAWPRPAPRRDSQRDSCASMDLRFRRAAPPAPLSRPALRRTRASIAALSASAGPADRARCADRRPRADHPAMTPVPGAARAECVCVARAGGRSAPAAAPGAAPPPPGCRHEQRVDHAKRAQPFHSSAMPSRTPARSSLPPPLAR